MSRWGSPSTPLGVVFLSALLPLAAVHCGAPPASPPPPPAEPSAPIAPAPSETTPVATAPLPAASASVPVATASRPPLVIAKGCLTREGVEGDVQARMKGAGLLEAGKTELDGEGHRKLSTRPLADLDGDGTEELTLADEGTGNYNQLTFLYVSNKGCWTFSHVSMATAFAVEKTKANGPRELRVFQKASSCNDPKDRDSFTITVLRASEAGWTKARTTVCPCAQLKGTKECADGLP